MAVDILHSERRVVIVPGFEPAGNLTEVGGAVSVSANVLEQYPQLKRGWWLFTGFLLLGQHLVFCGSEERQQLDSRNQDPLQDHTIQR